MDKIVLVHLSDIHFNRASGVSVHDLDKNVRNELVLDATRVVSEAGPVTGVLVTGDIAFSGDKIEYMTATKWLREFCGTIGCPAENVWVVPGNHDVDRPKAKRILTRTLHEAIRKEGADVDKKLREILSDEQSAAALLDPLAEYNIFAGQFGCSISADKHFWERDLILACGTQVRLRGLTSALVSNEEDRRPEIVLGEAQASVERSTGVLHVTLCHHPPDWLRDHDSVENHLKNKVHIQLFGHKHSQRLDSINGNVRLVAGAMHPARREGGWRPTYNILEISRQDSDHIGLRVYQRHWHEVETKFVAGHDTSNGRNFREFLWDEFSTNTKAVFRSVESHVTCFADFSAATPISVVATPASEKDNAMTPQDHKRRLTYRFLTLPFRHQIAIANNLNVLTDADRALNDEALFRVLFKRADESHLLGALWAETEKLHEDPAEFNPFEDSE